MPPSPNVHAAMLADPNLKEPPNPVEDIVGPGRTEPVLKPVPAQTGPRISRRARGLVVGGATLLTGAVIGGVLLAGHTSGHRRRAGRVAPGSVEQVGQAPPPMPPPLKIRAGAAGAGIPSGLVAPSAGSGASDVQPALDSGSFAGTVVQQALDYRRWRLRQTYKVLKQQVQTEQEALTAPIRQDGDRASTAVSSGSVFQSPLPALPQPARDDAGTVPTVRSGSGEGADRRFLEAQRRRRARSGDLHETLQRPASAQELFAGSVLPAVLLTGIDSDLPGEVVAQVRQNIYNSLDPDERLIPQGTRLIGIYRSAVSYGQRRALVAWRRIIFPDGATLALQGMPGTDSLGRAGFRDQVDNHYGRIFGSAFLVSMLGAGAQLAQPQNGGLLNTPTAEQQASANLANEMNHVGAHLLDRNLGIAPTLRIRPGYLFDVLVTRTMILPPYP